eukprot:6198504-Pleurochrysis_carterae.AAC.2
MPGACSQAHAHEQRAAHRGSRIGAHAHAYTCRATKSAKIGKTTASLSLSCRIATVPENETVPQLRTAEARFTKTSAASFQSLSRCEQNTEATSGRNSRSCRLRACTWPRTCRSMRSAVLGLAQLTHSRSRSGTQPLRHAAQARSSGGSSRGGSRG